MAKKVVKPVLVKSAIATTLKEKIIAAISKVLRENNSELTDTIQKAVKKASKKIIKKTEMQVTKVLNG